MPHLMIETFMSQWVWLVLIIFGLYFQLVTVLIPKVSNSFKARRSLESTESKVKGLSGSQAESLSISITNKIEKKEGDYSKEFKNSFASWSSSV